MATRGKWHLQTLIGENEEILSVEMYSHYLRNEDTNSCTICEVFAYIITPYRGIHHEHMLYALQTFNDENPNVYNIF